MTDESETIGNTSLWDEEKVTTVKFTVDVFAPQDVLFFREGKNIYEARTLPEVAFDDIDVLVFDKDTPYDNVTLTTWSNDRQLIRTDPDVSLVWPPADAALEDFTNGTEHPTTLRLAPMPMQFGRTTIVVNASDEFSWFNSSIAVEIVAPPSVASSGVMSSTLGLNSPDLRGGSDEGLTFEQLLAYAGGWTGPDDMRYDAEGCLNFSGAVILRGASVETSFAHELVISSTGAPLVAEVYGLSTQNVSETKVRWGPLPLVAPCGCRNLSRSKRCLFARLPEQISFASLRTLPLSSCSFWPLLAPPRTLRRSSSRLSSMSRLTSAWTPNRARRRACVVPPLLLPSRDRASCGEPRAS